VAAALSQTDRQKGVKGTKESKKSDWEGGAKLGKIFERKLGREVGETSGVNTLADSAPGWEGKRVVGESF